MKKHLMKTVIASAVCMIAMAGIATTSNAAVGVDVSTPNVRVQVGTPPIPQPSLTVIERERVIVHESDRHDRGKHKGHYKKHKKHKHKKHD